MTLEHYSKTATSSRKSKKNTEAINFINAIRYGKIIDEIYGENNCEMFDEYFQETWEEETKTLTCSWAQYQRTRSKSRGKRK